MSDIVKRLRDNGQLDVCPYDRKSPEYWTAPDDKPCRICGTENKPDAPDLCRGADTTIFKQAADRIEALEAALKGMSEKIAVESRDLRAHGEYRRGLAVAASMVDLHARAALGE